MTTNIITILSYARAALILSAMALLAARETHRAYWRLASPFLLSVDDTMIGSVVRPCTLAEAGSGVDVSIFGGLLPPRKWGLGGGYGVQNLYCRAENGSFVPAVECARF
ncbi:tryptophan 2,3- dioxygenase [Hypoxylon texense]